MFQWLKSFHLFVITYILKIFIFLISYEEALQAGGKSKSKLVMKPFSEYAYL